jgi:F-type H+-transporting ATPase subunit a
MEHGSFWIADKIDQILGPLVLPLKMTICNSIYKLFGATFVAGPKVIPEHIAFALIIFTFCCVAFPLLRRSFSMEKPGEIQQVLEVVVEFLNQQLEENIGHGGKKFLPMIGTIGFFVLLMNLAGQVPILASPTGNINVTLGCALSVFLYYNYLGFTKMGFWRYLMHFAGPVWWLAPLMFPIEIISHLARPFSMTVRLFANIFGEHLIVGVFFSLIPLLLPLPIMVLGLVTSFIQAFIFVILTMVYVGGAVAEEH